MIRIRKFADSDWPSCWRFIEPVLRAGESWPQSPDIDEAGARELWSGRSIQSFVVTDDSGSIIGIYYIKPNQPTLGAHVCNAGYIVAEEARGRGVGSEMCRHSQQQALSSGFSAMQFNLVVATNESAVRAWKKSGFEIAGTLPEAFRHSRLGLVDAYVMYRLLDAESRP
jgi:RimJ/RimL family protein N-acetyltransferase